MATDLTIRTYPEAQRVLRASLTALHREHHPDFTPEVIDRLVRYVFGGTEDDCFWSLVCWFNTLEPHDSTWRTFYFARGGEDVKIRTRAVEALLEQLKKSINNFCAEGPLPNEVLNLLDERYRERLNARGPAGSVSLPSGYNLIVELRDAIKDNEEEIVEIDLSRVPATYTDFTVPQNLNSLGSSRAVYNATRDAEVLIHGAVPPEALGRIHYP